MPLSIEDFKYPKFTKIVPKVPFGESTADKFYATTGDNHTRRYKSGSFPQAGYNPNLNQATPRDINVNKDDYTLPPY
jgi:hypothetical protein